MWRGRQFVLVVAACAALVAQATPTALCSACDQPCCTARTGGNAPAAGMASTGGCPLCAAHAGLMPAEADGQPCHCQLEARRDQPLVPSRNCLSQHADDAPALGPTAAPPPVPQALGVSREYVAASLAVPIRPARILWGVWRN